MIQLLRGLSGATGLSSLVLSAGQPFYETDTQKLKIGDGSSTYESLNYIGSSERRAVRLVIGTSTSGWTSDECDYLCDGTSDDVEINTAIQALPSTGGEIVILDGTYNITATIAINKDNVVLSGNGTATVLKRMYDGSSDSGYYEGVISITALNGGCCIENLKVDGNLTEFRSSNNGNVYVESSNNIIRNILCNSSGDRGIQIRGSSYNVIIGNICNDNSRAIMIQGTSTNNFIANNYFSRNNSGAIMMYSSCDSNTIIGNVGVEGSWGVQLSGDNNVVVGNRFTNVTRGIYVNGDHNSVCGNVCNDNTVYGIDMYYSDSNTIVGNVCNNNTIGIQLMSSNNNLISGNTCIRGLGTGADYTNSQYTIYVNSFGAGNNYNLIIGNTLMGKNYTTEGGTSNTFVNNKYN